MSGKTYTITVEEEDFGYGYVLRGQRIPYHRSKYRVRHVGRWWHCIGPYKPR